MEIKNKVNNSLSQKKLRKKNKDINSINSSYSSLFNKDKSMNNNDSYLKVLDQYYTINNTINITNNNALMGNFMNNQTKNNEKYYKDDKAIIQIKKIFKYLDKDNLGFIILNMNQKLKDIFIKNNLLLNKEQEDILEKIFKFLFKNHKKDNNFELDKDKIIINEKSFLKYLNEIFKNNLNTNERNIFLSIESDYNNSNKKRIILSKAEKKI